MASTTSNTRSHKRKRSFDDDEDPYYRDLSSSDDDADESDADIEVVEIREKLPHAAAYDEDFPNVHRKLLELLHNVVECIPEEKQDNPTLKHLREQGTRCAQPLGVRKRRINIVGRTGSGKSSLLNSILGRSNAAKAAASGESCTTVPTTYCYPFAGQTRPFAIEPNFYTQDEIGSIIRMLLDDYYRSQRDDLHDEDIEEVANIKTAGATAFKTFRALFCNKTEFSTDIAGAQFLQAEYQPNLSGVTKAMQEWVDQLCKAKLDDEQFKGKSFAELETKEELDKYLELFAFSNPSMKDPRLFPIVKTVRIGLQGIEILKHHDLTDFPGSGDVNKLRGRAAAERVYVDVDEIWIVAPANRIASDQALIRDILRYGNDVPCVLMCTWMDDGLDSKLANCLKSSGEDTSEYELLYTKADHLRSQTAHLEKRHRKAERRRKRTKASQQDQFNCEQEAGEALRELVKHREAVKTVDCERFLALYGCRQKHIGCLLKTDILPLVSLEKPLKVFFVSNTHYAASLKGGEPVVGPLLGSENTGISEIRQWMFGRLAPNILSAQWQFIDHSVAVFLQGLKILANPEDQMFCKKALAIVDDRRANLAQSKERCRSKVADLIGQRLHSKLKFEDYSAYAMTILVRKQEWNYQTVKACVRRRGVFKSKVQGDQSWNQEISRTFIEDLSELLRDFGDKVLAPFKNLREELRSFCESIIEDLSREKIQHGVAKDNFGSFMRGQIPVMEEVCDSGRDNFVRELTNIKMNAIDADRGYFRDAMNKVYDFACSDQFTGKGHAGKMMTVIQAYFSPRNPGSPFITAAESIKRDIMKQLNSSLEKVLEDVQHKLKDIRLWLDATIQRDANGEDQEIRQSLQVCYDDAERVFQDIKNGLRTIEWRHEEESLLKESKARLQAGRIKSEKMTKKEKMTGQDKFTEPENSPEGPLEGSASRAHSVGRPEPSENSHIDSGAEVLDMTQD